MIADLVNSSGIATSVHDVNSGIAIAGHDSSSIGAIADRVGINFAVVDDLDERNTGSTFAGVDSNIGATAARTHDVIDFGATTNRHS